MVRAWLLAPLLLVLSVGSMFASVRPAHARDRKQVIAYIFMRDRVLQPADVDARPLTRINYAFANLQDGKMVEGFSHDAENFSALLALKQQNPRLQVLVSVGGWTWSKQFSDMALTRESRQVFIDSAVEFLERYKLDGLDMDWEYPGMRGDDNPFRAEDRENYTALLQELRLRFNREQRRLHRRLLLTIAAGASAHFLEHTQMNLVARYVDTVNLMTYDFYGGDRNTGDHAPLYENPIDPKHASSDTAVQRFLAAGVPRNKLVLGVPFYGKGWHGVADTNNGLYQPGESARDLHLSYGDISHNLLQPGSGYVRYWDETSKAPYLYNAALQPGSLTKIPNRFGSRHSM